MPRVWFLLVLFPVFLISILHAEVRVLSRNDDGSIAAFQSDVFDVTPDGTQVLMSYRNTLLSSNDPDRIATAGLYLRNLVTDT